jgi:hypothetical protein
MESEILAISRLQDRNAWGDTSRRAGAAPPVTWRSAEQQSAALGTLLSRHQKCWGSEDVPVFGRATLLAQVTSMAKAAGYEVRGAVRNAARSWREHGNGCKQFPPSPRWSTTGSRTGGDLAGIGRGRHGINRQDAPSHQAGWSKPGCRVVLKWATHGAVDGGSGWHSRSCRSPWHGDSPLVGLNSASTNPSAQKAVGWRVRQN